MKDSCKNCVHLVTIWWWKNYPKGKMKGCGYDKTDTFTNELKGGIGVNYMIFKIYLAGAMGAFGKEQFNEGNSWREYMKILLEHTDSQYRVICCNPNDYYNFLEKNHKTELEVQRFDLDKVKNSDLIIVNFNADSIGTSKEIAIANDMGIPVIGLNEGKRELHPWDINDCRRIFDKVEDLIEYVIDFYLL